MDEYYTESVLISKDDYTKNLDNWKPEKGHNVLFVTGLSGSGKSTTAKKIETEEKCINITLDNFEWNENLFKYKNVSPSNQIIKDYFIKTYGGKIKQSDWSDDDFGNKFDSFIKYIMKYADDHPDELFILEGIQVYCRCGKLVITGNYPLIIKGTSVLKSMYRRYNRDKGNESKTPMELIKWYISHDKLIKDFKNKEKEMTEGGLNKPMNEFSLDEKFLIEMLEAEALGEITPEEFCEMTEAVYPDIEESDYYTEGTNLDIRAEFKAAKKEFKQEVSPVRNLIKQGKYDEAIKHLEKAKKSIEHASKVIESAESSTGSVVLGYFVQGLPDFGQYMLLACGYSASFAVATGSAMAGKAGLAAVGGVGASASIIAMAAKELVVFVKNVVKTLNKIQAKMKSGKEVSVSDFNMYQTRLTVICDDYIKWIDKMELAIQDAKKADKEEVKKESVELSNEDKFKMIKAKLYQECANDKITIDDRERLIMEARNKYLTESEEVIDDSLKDDEELVTELCAVGLDEESLDVLIKNGSKPSSVSLNAYKQEQAKKLHEADKKKCDKENAERKKLKKPLIEPKSFQYYLSQINNLVAKKTKKLATESVEETEIVEESGKEVDVDTLEKMIELCKKKKDDDKYSDKAKKKFEKIIDSLEEIMDGDSDDSDKEEKDDKKEDKTEEEAPAEEPTEDAGTEDEVPTEESFVDDIMNELETVFTEAEGVSEMKDRYRSYVSEYNDIMSNAKKYLKANKFYEAKAEYEKAKDKMVKCKEDIKSINITKQDASTAVLRRIALFDLCGIAMCYALKKSNSSTDNKLGKAAMIGVSASAVELAAKNDLINRTDYKMSEKDRQVLYSEIVNKKEKILKRCDMNINTIDRLIDKCKSKNMNESVVEGDSRIVNPDPLTKYNTIKGVIYEKCSAGEITEEQREDLLLKVREKYVTEAAEVISIKESEIKKLTEKIAGMEAKLRQTPKESARYKSMEQEIALLETKLEREKKKVSDMKASTAGKFERRGYLNGSRVAATSRPTTRYTRTA